MASAVMRRDGLFMRERYTATEIGVSGEQERGPGEGSVPGVKATLFPGRTRRFSSGEWRGAPYSVLLTKRVYSFSGDSSFRYAFAWKAMYPHPRILKTVSKMLS